MGKQRRNILTITGQDAKEYFLRPSSYFSTQLPPYFNFEPVLKEVEQRLDAHPLEYFCVKDPANFPNINYDLLNNKDGQYAWRSLQLLHPAFYVDLVNFLTEREHWIYLKERIIKFRKNLRVISAVDFISTEEIVADRPLEIVNWWHKVEQESIRLSLDYDFVLHTDITDCYGSISERLIAETFEDEIGPRLNYLLRAMSGGQHRGLPQGSSLMDFLAEVALGFLDWKLANTLNNAHLTKDYVILRYRDDYRIFTNNPELAERLAKVLAEVLEKYHMRLNPAKTELFSDTLTAAIKPDKIYWNEHRALLYIDDSGEVGEPSLQRHLLAVRELAKRYPGSGSVQTALVDLYKNRIYALETRPQNLDQLVAIVVDIAITSPRVYYICSAILSRFIPLYNDRAGRKMLMKIRERMKRVPYSDYFEVCLQRLTVKRRRNETYDVPLCKILYSYKTRIWNSEWLSFTIDERKLIDSSIISAMDTTVPVEEANLFSPFDSSDAPMLK